MFLTALAEELIFRGALLSIAHATLSARAAHMWVSSSFALWHVGNALAESEDASTAGRIGNVLGTLVLTGAGSFVFIWLRYRTRSLLGPVLAHIASNLPGRALDLSPP